MPHEEIEWWNFNIPHYERTAECPVELLDSGDKDRRLIGSWDADYEPLSWEHVKKLIDTNRIDLFQRVPSDLRRYRFYIYHLEKEHGSVIQYIQHQLLNWSHLRPNGPPFGCADDIKTLYNDWPYGIDERIVHLVVWTKFQLEEDKVTGDLTSCSRRQIQDFIDGTFGARVAPERIAWFKNWRSLKSVHAVEHFHVMLFDPDMAFIDEITGGHVPMSMRMRDASAPAN